MTFYVGQKVVCVDAGGHDRYVPRGFKSSREMHGLTEGRVYTVRWVGPALFGVMGIRVDEIIRPDCPIFGREAAFAAARFRPVVERKTDISLFTAMLNPKRDRVSA
jgi:hypothetical protein